jgi:integrase
VTSLGVRGKENEAGAVQAWHRLMAGVREEKAKPKVEPTVEAVLRGFLADVQDRAKPNTVRVYGNFFCPFWKAYGKVKASELTTVQAEAYARRQSWSDSTRNAFLGALATAFRWAERARWIERTPLVGLKRPPKASRGAETLVTAEEHARLLQAATPEFAMFLRVLYATGARPGEVAGITAGNFDANLGVVRLREHKTAHKGQSRTVYLTPEAVALLLKQREQQPEGPLLRNTRGKPWRPKAIVKAMIATRERAGISHALAYGYRHSFATDALADGVPEAHVAALLGHASTAMLHKNYSHLLAKQQVLRDAIGRVRA